MKFKRDNSVAFAEIDEEICIFSPIHAEYFSLNETASYIWGLLESPLTFDDIVAKLILRFKIKEDICREETKKFLKEAKNKNLINEG